jgi:hypothetical protein
MRYMLLNVDDTKSLGMGVYYSNPNKLDVYYNDIRVPPKNEGSDKHGNNVLLSPGPNNPDEFMPHPQHDAPGANYYDRPWQMVYIVVKGPLPVVVRTTRVIVVAFNIPSLTEDDFYGEHLVKNLAAFLGIPESKIRRVDIVSASTGSRPKRATNADNDVIVVDIGDESLDTLDSEPSYSISQDLPDIASKIIDEAQVCTRGHGVKGSQGHASKIIDEAQVYTTL